MLLEDVLGDLAGARRGGDRALEHRRQADGALLTARSCTVTIAHSRTRDLPAVCRRADILVAAVGRPEMVKADWVKPGATVIDVGINRIDEGGRYKLVGDVDFARRVAVAGAITPVPGGVGPMTIAVLLRNTLVAAHLRAGLRAARRACDPARAPARRAERGGCGAHAGGAGAVSDGRLGRRCARAAAPDAIVYAPRKTSARGGDGAGCGDRRGARPASRCTAWTSCDGTLGADDRHLGTGGIVGHAVAAGTAAAGSGSMRAGMAVTTRRRAPRSLEDHAACPGPLGAAWRDCARPLPDTPVPIAALTGRRAGRAGRDRRTGRMPTATLRLGGIDAEGASADRTLRWRINAVVGARAGAHLLRLWSWDGRRYRVALVRRDGDDAG